MSTLESSNPLPSVITGRLRAQLTFILEVDKLKTIVRRSTLASVDRLENDAEHSWHLALMVTVLAEHSDVPIDVGHTIELVLVHDLVEIYAGDTPLYDRTAPDVQQQREEQAAGQLFGLLPEDQELRFRALWDEFEARVTPEARFAKAMDRLEPTLLNWMARGGTWQSPGVTTAEVLERKAVIADGSESLWQAARAVIQEGGSRGWSRQE